MENKISMTNNELKEILQVVLESSFDGKKFKNAVGGVVEESFNSKRFKDAVGGVVEESFNSEKFKNAVESTFSGDKFANSVKSTFTGEEFKDVVKGTFVSEEFNSAVKGTFTSGEFRDSVQNAVMNALAEFDTEITRPNLEKVKQEIKQEIHNVMDYTDRRVGEAEGRIIPKISTLTNVLKDKRIIDDEDAMSVRKAGLAV